MAKKEKTFKVPSVPTPLSRPSGQDEAAKTDVDELARRLRETKGVDQDVASLVAENWQTVLGSVAVVVLVILVTGYWKQTRQESIDRGAKQFEQVQNAYAAVVAGAADKQQTPSAEDAEAAQKENKNTGDNKSQLFKTFADNITLLEKSDSTYGDFGPLYRAAAEVENGDWDNAKKHLQSYGVDQPQESKKGEPINEKTLLTELAHLVYARLLLAEGKTPYADLRKRLENQIDAASFTSVEALLMLFRISSNAQELTAAQETARQLIAKRPELAETIKVELGNLGIGLES